MKDGSAEWKTWQVYGRSVVLKTNVMRFALNMANDMTFGLAYKHSTERF